MVVHSCNPSYVEGVSRRIVAQGHTSKKNMGPYVKNEAQRAGCVSGGKVPAPQRQGPEFRPPCDSRKPKQTYFPTLLQCYHCH
jgi:hypothetical protein